MKSRGNDRHKALSCDRRPGPSAQSKTGVARCVATVAKDDAADLEQADDYREYVLEPYMLIEERMFGYAPLRASLQDLYVQISLSHCNSRVKND